MFDTNLQAKVRFLAGTHERRVDATDQLNVINEASVQAEHFLVIHAMPMRKKWQPLWNWMQQGGSS
ncbi:MAG TPA: hypothetical protein VGP37_12865 [Candidatus Nanopelagicales bacterium]|nr:hypothetical protein [Candidatus Nanopelagicales bacterium]